MREFWVIFNQEWSASIQRRDGEGSASSPPLSSSIDPSGGASGQKGDSCKKRGRECHGNSDSDEEGTQDPKRNKRGKSQLKDRDDSAKFACPYRKHNPQKYCLLEWRLCALTPLDSVARVKYVEYDATLSSFGFANQMNTEDTYIATTEYSHVHDAKETFHQRWSSTVTTQQ